MLKVSIVCFSLGILLILSSFIKFKKRRNVNYTVPKFREFIDKLKKNKLLSSLINVDSDSNKKLLNKIQVISQCKQSEDLNKYKFRINRNNSGIENRKIKNSEEVLKNIFLIKISLFIIIIILSFTGKYVLNSMVVKETLNSASIHNDTNYMISIIDAQSVVSYVGDDYKLYIKNNDINGLKEYIFNFVTENKLNVDQETVYSICDIYIRSYGEGDISLEDIGYIFLLAVFSTLLVNILINLQFKIYNVKLLSEFYSMELIAILHMNRNELNVYEILTELNKYSIYLKPYFTRCLNRYTSSPAIALDTLIKEVNNPNFSSFILILKSCLDNSKNINSEVLKLQRKLRFLNDRLENDKSLEFKQLCLTIAQLPLILTFVINILIPFLNDIGSNI